MKKQLSIFCSILLVSMASAQTTWNTTLNSGTSAPKFGLSTDNTLGFYTNNIQRLTLTGAGRFGIGTVTPVAELHVVGKGLFSGGVNSNGPITFSDQFFLRYIKGSGADPNIYYTGPLGGTVTFKAPCNVFYKDLIQYDPNGTPSSVPFSPPVANLFNDIIQLKLSTGTPASVLNMGVLSNGDGVIAVEPITYNGTTTNMLKLNPGCSSDVYICEGGGATKIFGRGYVVGDFEANSNVRIGAPPFAANARFELQAIGATGNAVNIWNPSSVATDKSIFRLSNTGKTLIGTNLSSTPAMLTVGQSVKADKALVLTDNTSTTNKDFFTVQGNGQTFIGTNLISTPAMLTVGQPVKADKALVLTDNTSATNKDFFTVQGNGQTFIGFDLQPNNLSMFTVGQSNANALALSLTNNANAAANKDFFNVYGSGYTEIKVYSPAGMPIPAYTSVTNPRVFTIRDVSNSNPASQKDIFAITASGKVYAREVEISASTVLNFPDYVFDTGYELKSIGEVDRYIAKNKHLPGFEKAEYYEKNGLNVSELFIKQQEKIEEMMLYIIELEKRLQLLEGK